MQNQEEEEHTNAKHKKKRGKERCKKDINENMTANYEIEVDKNNKE